MKYLIPAALLLALGPAAPAMAAPRPLDLLGAVERAERAVQGQVVEVDLDRDRQGRQVYEIEVVRKGDLREVRIDARTGRVLGSSPERIEGLMWQVKGNDLVALAKARPLSAIIRDIETRSGGKVIDVDFDVEGGQARYELDLSTDAGIAGLYIDPKTGQRLDFVVDD